MDRIQFGHSLKSGHEGWDPETRGPGIRDPDTRDPGNGFLGLGNCSPKTHSPESRTLRIELVTQIPSITARTTD